MIIGFDFDNTIINYTKSFIYLSRKKKLVPEKNNKNKISIRNYLRKNNIEDEWTILQGEVYGKNIMRAEIYVGVLEALLYLSKKNIKIKIISHKTKYPYIGEKINLRCSAMNWIKKNLIFNSNIKINQKDVFFEDTIENKIIKIKEEKCDIYIDDLPEILNLLPSKIKKILFSPDKIKNHNSKFSIMNSWKEFPDIIKIYERQI